MVSSPQVNPTHKEQTRIKATMQRIPPPVYHQITLCTVILWRVFNLKQGKFFLFTHYNAHSWGENNSRNVIVTKILHFVYAMIPHNRSTCIYSSHAYVKIEMGFRNSVKMSGHKHTNYHNTSITSPPHACLTHVYMCILHVHVHVHVHSPTTHIHIHQHVHIPTSNTAQLGWPRLHIYTCIYMYMCTVHDKYSGTWGRYMYMYIQ